MPSLQNLLGSSRKNINQVHQQFKKTVGGKQTEIAAKNKQVIEKRHSITSTVSSHDTYVTLSDDFHDDREDIEP